MRLSWKIYTFFYCLMIILGAGYSLWPNSSPNVYYKILVSFHKDYQWQYILYQARIFFDLFGLVPLLLFIWRKNWLKKLFWKAFFPLKILSLFLGSFYEIKVVKSYFPDAPLLTSATVLASLLAILPYYAAIFGYAFRKNNEHTTLMSA